MRSFYTLIIFLLCSSILKSQNIEKVWFDTKDSTYGFYTVVKPYGQRIQGALVIFDGYSGNAESALTETKLHNVASANELVTIFIPNGRRLFLDDVLMKLTNEILSIVKEKYGLRKDQFAFGGFSSGGTIALRYVELCYQIPAEFPVQPKAVFSVDSPVDLLDMYQSTQRELKKGSTDWWMNESHMIIDTLKKNLGDPEVSIKNFKKASPFLISDSTSGNAWYLKNVAYRTYHDVDPSWYIKNRKRSLYGTNMLNASELIVRLNQLGNTQAEFIASKTAGMRSNGFRHPHSWSIVDEIDLVQWLRAKLNFYPDHLLHPYSYGAPANWDTETFLFPIDFAPTIQYDGIEDLRFAPSWNKDSTEKWSYTFLWWLDKQYPVNENILTQNLTAYYSGLTHRRAVADKLDMKQYFPAKAEVKREVTATNDVSTYSATVRIFDAQVTRKPGVLHIKIHQKKCADADKALLLFEISGFTYDNPIWGKLDKINEDFKCE